MKYSKSLIFVAVCALIAATALAIDVPLQPNVWVDVTAPPSGWSDNYVFAVADNSTREAIIRMRKKNPEESPVSDPDLYVRMDAEPTTSEYDARDYQPASVHEVDLRIRAPKLRQGFVYIKIHSYYAVASNVQIMIQPYSCWHKNCHEGVRGTCHADTGHCECKPEWNLRPNCLAKRVDLHRADFNTTVAGHLEDDDEVIYHFTVHEPLPTNVHFTFDRATYRGPVEMRLRHGALPGPGMGNIAEHTVYLLSGSIDVRTAQLSPGDYYLSISGSNLEAQDFVLTPRYHQCPHSCYHHGECHSNNNTCTCDPQHRIVPDCSVFHFALQSGHHYPLHLPAHENHIYEIIINKAIADSPSDIIFGVHTHNHPTSYPRIFVHRGAVPTIGAFEYTNSVPAHNFTTVKIPHTDVRPEPYFIAVLNNDPTPLNATVYYLVRPYCPPRCHEHGHCNDLGVCICQSGFRGGDCSVPPESSDDTSGVSVAVLVVCIFLFLFIGIGGGYLLRKKFGGEAPNPVDPNQLQYAHMNS